MPLAQIPASLSLMSTPASHETQRKWGQILILGVNQEEALSSPRPHELFPTHLQHPGPAGAHGTARPWRGSPGRNSALGSEAASLRALSPNSEDLHGSAPLPPPILSPWGLPRPCLSLCGIVTLPGSARRPRCPTQPLGSCSVVWMWEKSKKCFLLLPLPAWLLSTTPS